MKYTVKPHALKDGFTAAIHLAEGNGKLIAEVRGEKYAKELAANGNKQKALEFVRGWFKDNELEQEYYSICEVLDEAIKGEF